MRRNDPELVREKYASEAGLEARRWVDMRGRSSFSPENAELQLRRRFAAIERHARR